MVYKFDVARYSRLLKKKSILEEESKFLFDEPDYLELLDFEASVEEQSMYNRRNDYFLLIDKYLNQLITSFRFRNEFLEMETQDATKAKKILQNPQQLSSFSLVENLEAFSDLMNEISDLCFEMGEVDEGNRPSEDEFYNAVNSLYLQLKKSFEN